MKTNILFKSKLLLLAIGLLFIYNSNSNAASLKATPSSLSFSTAVNTQQTKSSNLQGVSLILGLNAPTTFSITLSGADADQFMIENPSPSLTTLITTLLGIGYDTKIVYKPNRSGTHTAKAIVNGNFLLLGDLSTEITLTGNTVDITPPAVVSTTPDNNSTKVVTGTSISVTYDEPIVLANSGLIKINGGNVSATVSGNVLSITPSTALTFNTNYTVQIGAGAVKDASNNSSATSSFSFSTQQTPGLVVSSQNVAFVANLPGGQQVKYVNVKGSNLLVLNALENFNVSLEGADANQFTVEQPSLSLVNLLTALLGDGLDIKITYKPVAAGPHNDAQLKITGKLLFIGLLNTTVSLTGTTNTADTSLPYPISTSPKNGDTGVSINPTITITYSEAIALNNSSAITINGSGAQASVSGNVLTVTPSQPLPYNTNNTVTIGAGAVKDAAGNLSAAYSLSFSSQNVPALVTSSSSLAFSTGINTEQSKSVNVKGSNLLVLNVLEDFDVVLSGANANQFEVVGPTPSLTNLLTALLGNGYDIVIKYKPTTAGPHTAKVSVTGKVLGAANVLSAEINLSGQTLDVTPPQITSTNPRNGDTGVGIRSVITATYNEPIVLNNSSLVTITNSSNGASTSASVSTSGSTLSITPNTALEYGKSYEVKIGAGAIKDGSNNSTTSNYTFVFTSEGSTSTPTGMQETFASKTIVSEVIYNISGIRVTKAEVNGIYIKKIKYDDGTTETVKFYQYNK